MYINTACITLTLDPPELNIVSLRAKLKWVGLIDEVISTNYIVRHVNKQLRVHSTAALIRVTF